MRRRSILPLLLALAPSAFGTTFTFNTDPFAGTTATTTPGRQVIGNEIFINFNIGLDVFAFVPAIFGAGNQVLFANNVAASLPTGGVNVVVLRSFDDDNNPATAFGAGNAANLIASQITTPGAGFFIYFNSGLDLPRLVFSTDLNDNTADLKILARLQNLGGQNGRDAMATFAAGNFTFAADTAVPEPTSLAMGACALALVFALRLRPRR